MAQAVIMAGGQGERFWPLTHSKFPKYRIKLDSKSSLLQKTYQRLLKVYGRQNIHLVTTKDHVGLIRKELPRLRASNIIVEPLRNNTSSAILYSCAQLKEKFGEKEVVSFFPADHLIENTGLFKKTLREAIRLAREKELLVAIGIKPTFPATGFGYIECGPKIKGFSLGRQVRRFKEKPNRRLALRYVRKNNFLWNGGIFTWRISVFMAAMRKFSPKIYRLFNIHKLAESYRKLPAISIDYALLEKVDRMAVVKTRMDWCDMGSWDMFLEKAATDRNQNFIYGNALHQETRSSLLVNHNKIPLVALGVKGLIVVQTDQGTLICNRNRSEEAALILKKSSNENLRR